MVVTKLEVQKKNTSRLNLHIDGVFVSGIGSKTITNFGIYKSKEITQSELDEILEFEIFSRFYDRAITYVTGAIKSEKQVRDYLKRLYFKKKKEWIGEGVVFDVEVTIDNILSKMKTYNFINDKEYALHFISSRERSKPRSKRLISSELFSKGISKEIIDSVIDSLDDDSMIYDVYIKKYGLKSFDIYEDPKVSGFLARKGFSWDDITKLAKRLDDEFGK